MGWDEKSIACQVSDMIGMHFDDGLKTLSLATRCVLLIGLQEGLCSLKPKKWAAGII